MAGRQIGPKATVLVLNVKDRQEQGQTPAVGSGQCMVAKKEVSRTISE